MGFEVNGRFVFAPGWGFLVFCPSHGGKVGNVGQEIGGNVGNVIGGNVGHEIVGNVNGGRRVGLLGVARVGFGVVYPLSITHPSGTYVGTGYVPCGYGFPVGYFPADGYLPGGYGLPVRPPAGNFGGRYGFPVLRSPPGYVPV